MGSLVLRDVTKRFGQITAASDISLRADSGRILGLLGPNGAGKTTVIRIIANILTADEGSVTLNEHEVGAWSQEQMGYLPEERGLYKKIKVQDQLRYLAQLKGMPRMEAMDQIQYWLDRLGIEKWGARKVQDLSKGMQQKVQFIATILAYPKLIILDEPFSGLDPVNSELLCDIIAELKEDGRIILLASHRMDQVEKLCDDICLIAKGKILLSGDLREVKRRFKREKLALEYTGSLRLLDELEKKGTIQYLERSEDGCILHLSDGCHPRDLLEQLLLVDGLELFRFELLQPTLNEIFIQTVGDS